MIKCITAHRAAELIPAGASILFGGFLGCGSAHHVIDALAESGKGGFTAICNDAGLREGPDGGSYGLAKLIHNRQIRQLVASHVGLNPEVAAQMGEGTLEVALLPQGSLVEMIRAGGAGLGGVLTPTGVGTLIEENTEFVESVREVDGKRYLLMRPIRADVALIGGYRVDRAGNIWYKGTTRNFNPVMATAAGLVIVEADHVVESGQIEPENVVTPGVLVDYVVEAGCS